jgi:hypothetical protein
MAVTGSVQAAVRYSRTGGQPRSHAARYPAAPVTVTGQAAMAIAASSSHPVILAILRSSHRATKSFSQDQIVTAAPR